MKPLPTSRHALEEAVSRGHVFDYLLFWGHRPGPRGPGPACLSQWWPASFDVDGELYPTAEHWMMAEKARLFGDEDMLDQILASPDPGRAKAMGRRVSGFDGDVWDDACFDIVVQGNVHKFRQNQAERGFLLSTGNKVLVEASPVDRIWGIGLAADHLDARTPSRWQGENLLGFALMVVRSQLRA